MKISLGICLIVYWKPLLTLHFAASMVVPMLNLDDVVQAVASVFRRE